MMESIYIKIRLFMLFLEYLNNMFEFFFAYYHFYIFSFYGVNLHSICPSCRFCRLRRKSWFCVSPIRLSVWVRLPDADACRALCLRVLVYLLDSLPNSRTLARRGQYCSNMRFRVLLTSVKRLSVLDALFCNSRMLFVLIVFPLCRGAG